VGGGSELLWDWDRKGHRPRQRSGGGGEQSASEGVNRGTGPTSPDVASTTKGLKGSPTTFRRATKKREYGRGLGGEKQ